MSEASTAAQSAQSKSVDISAIQDPTIRRVFREYHEQMMTLVNRQQMEIEALLEMLIDKNFTSMGEFKRQIQKRQSQPLSGSRIHEAVQSVIAPPAPKPPISRP